LACNPTSQSAPSLFVQTKRLFLELLAYGANPHSLNYTVFKKTGHFIFDDNLKKKCPIAIISGHFGSFLGTQIGHRTVASFSTPHLFSESILY